MKLKQYQTDTLSILRRFFEEARVAGPKGAYEAITKEPEQANRLGRYGGAYASLAELPAMPYVCLRLPTGGGKTILGAYAIGIARDAWVEKDYPMVLWLVPSNTIRLQTAEALKNARHPYRQAVDEAFDGRVRVFDIADFTHIRPHDIRDHCCIVVGTIQTLRVSNTEGRKVYAHNENMEPHFAALPKSLPGLETLEGGGCKFSFANLMHIHRPLMIVDEAHNAVTGLTREMQARVNPSAIIEFTATPRLNSNILHGVTAQELKLEEMIKLPIMLSEHDTWQNAVNGAIAARALAGRGSRQGPRLHPSHRPVPGSAEGPGGDGRGAEEAPDGGRADPRREDRRGDRRSAGARQDRSVRSEMCRRIHHHRRGAEGGLGLLLRLCLLLRLPYSERGGRGAASGPGPAHALCQAPQGGRAEPCLRLFVGAILRRGGTVAGRQAGLHGLRGGRSAGQHRARANLARCRRRPVRPRATSRSRPSSTP